MITHQEVLDKAKEFSLNANIIEKDYVLGWVLAGIYQQKQLSTQWIFKGGTCLKKCYFETYRFSEDLDYTLKNKEHINEAFLIERFKNIARWVYEETGIEIPENTIRFEVYKNKNGANAVEGRIGYIGPLRRRGEPVRIKLDLTADELLVLPPVTRDVHHPYSDIPSGGIMATCYSFHEVFAEKIRALSERARPRDLYDVIHLYRHVPPDLKPLAIFNVLEKKCAFKKISTPTMSFMESHIKRNELASEWENMLGHQLPVLPPLDQFWQELPSMFAWLYNEQEKISLEKIATPAESFNQTWQPPNMIQSWNTNNPIELIRFAGANHLCIHLSYDGTTRLIEPYDLKRTHEGHLLLIALRHDNREWRSYRMDKVQDIKVSQISFTPQYLISLS